MGLLKIFDKKKIEYSLENVQELNQQFPRTFLIPDKEEIENLEIGELVKLIFAMKKPQINGCQAERMWVEIIEKNGNYFTGKLDNDPYYLKTIKCGDSITFKKENIAGLYGGKSSFDENLFAIITKRALTNRQINYVVKSDDIDNEQDSGWQLFYGDEDEAYLDDTSNGSIISLEQVLVFEPLLESVFSGTGTSYEYSESENKFLVVNK